MRRLLQVSARRQSGMTIVELMVALVSGVILVGGVLSIFVNSKSSYNLNEGLSRLQENGRFAIEIFSSNIAHAGFKRDSTEISELAFPFDLIQYQPTGVSFPEGGQVLSGTDNNAVNTDSIMDGSDSISFRYQDSDSAPQMSDCFGVAIPADSVAIMTFYVASDSTLHCVSELFGDPSSMNDQAILDGVRDMQILYGVDVTTDRTANMYVDAATVTANDNWPNVVGIRVAMLMDTVDRVSQEPDTSTYNVLGVTHGPFNDELRRHVFTSTVALRNRLP